MRCCCFGDPNTPSLKHKGIVERRQCRDVVCLLFFLVFWIGMFVVCTVGFTKGSLNRLIYGYDSYGFLCGTNNDGSIDGVEGPDLSEFKKLYYLNPLEMLNPKNFKSAKSICVKSCPTEMDVCSIPDETVCQNANQFRCPYYRFAEEDLYNSLSGVESIWNTSYFDELGALPTDDSCDNSPISDFVGNITFATSLSNCGELYQAQSNVPGAGPCYPVYTETVEYFNRCFPKFSDETQEFIANLTSSNPATTFAAFKEEFGGASERLQRYVADITKGWIIIVVGGLCTSVLVAMIWLVILRYFAGVMAWLTVVLVNALFIGCTVFAFARSGRLGESGEVGAAIADKIPEDEDPTEKDREIWFYVSIVAAVLTTLLLLLTLVMIKRIRIAVAIIKVACQAIKTMPTLLFFPLLPFLVEVGLVIYFVFVSAMLYSSGDLVPKFKEIADGTDVDLGFVPTADLETQTGEVAANVTREECAMDPHCYYSVEWDSSLKYLFLYHFFGLLWTNQFIVGFGYVVIAGAVAHFYWSRADTDTITTTPVRTSIWNTFRYHLGSIALGSLIVAIIQFIRAVLEYINRKTKKMQENGNPALKYIMCCLRCMLWLLEKIVKFINRNAYIMVAVKGTGYCQSAGRAVSLLISNALRLVAVNIIGDVLLWLGKLAVTASCGLVAFLMSDSDYYTNEEKYPDTFLSSPLMPVLVSLLVGYVVAEIFFEVFEMTIDTVLLSFCEDCESHGGSPIYAPPLLLTAIGQSKKLHAKTTSIDADA